VFNERNYAGMTDASLQCDGEEFPSHLVYTPNEREGVISSDVAFHNKGHGEDAAATLPEFDDEGAIVELAHDVRTNVEVVEPLLEPAPQSCRATRQEKRSPIQRLRKAGAITT